MSRTSDEEKHLSQDSKLWIPGFEPRQHYWGEGLSPWHHIFSLAPSFFLGVSSVWKQKRLRAIKVYRAMDHGNVKRFRKGRWQGWAFFSLPFPWSLSQNQNRSSLSRLRIRLNWPEREAALALHWWNIKTWVLIRTDINSFLLLFSLGCQCLYWVCYHYVDDRDWAES